MIYELGKNKSARFYGTGLDIQIVGEALADLHTKFDRLTPQVVVDAAKPKKSPIHSAFEWDDTKAANAFRRTQARGLISTITVRKSEDDEPERAFVNVKLKDDEQYYRRAELVVETADEWAAVMRTALSALQSAYNRIDELERIAINHHQKPMQFITESKSAVIRASEILTNNIEGAP